MKKILSTLTLFATGLTLSLAANAATRTTPYLGTCVDQAGATYIIEAPGSCGLVQSCTVISATNTASGCVEISDCSDPYPSLDLPVQCNEGQGLM